MNSHDSVFAENHRCIGSLVARFSGHNGVDRAALLHWLRQFRLQDVGVALKLLCHVAYFTRTNIGTLTEQIVQECFRYLGGTSSDRVLFVVAASISESDAVVARALRHWTSVPERQMAEYLDLPSKQPGEYDAIVFLKDFSGTGTQLADWWASTGESLVLPLEAQPLLGVLVLNAPAKEKLRALGLPVVTVRELHGSDNFFQDQCTVFSEEQKSVILGYCRSTGASEEYVTGYGGNGLLLAFDHGCPNNSIPLLWHSGDSWTGLFRRHSWA